MADPAAAPGRIAFSRPLLGLILGQVCVHAAMAGTRLAVPLQALEQGAAEWVVGLLLAMFALAPVALALPAGRLADRHGYHRPMRLAVLLASTGVALAAASQALMARSAIPLPLHLGVLAGAAALAGAGTNIGLIAIQRTAGHLATTATERMRVFSWLGLAPAVANVVGPVLAGGAIDLGGFVLAFGLMAALPLASLAVASMVPMERSPGARPPRDAAALLPKVGAKDPPPARLSMLQSARELILRPGMRRLLLVNWLVSASWDVHTFLVPVLGHERGLSASAIGLVLGVFAASVAGVRLLIPLIAHRLTETQSLQGSMLLTATVFVAYPLAHTAPSMAACAAVLGLALGAVQPMIMSSLHRLTPPERHGEALALRSMTINAASTAMPLVFGAVGSAIGATTLFWSMALLVGGGSRLLGPLNRQLAAATPAGRSEADAARP